MLTAAKLLKLAEAGAFSRILQEVGRSGVPLGGVGPGGLELAALGVAVGRASEVSYEPSVEIAGLLGRLESAWEERGSGVSGSTAGLVVRGVSALVELCDRARGNSEWRGVAERASALLNAACAAAGASGRGRGALGSGGERAMRRWARATTAGASGGTTRAA